VRAAWLPEKQVNGDNLAKIEGLADHSAPEALFDTHHSQDASDCGEKILSRKTTILTVIFAEQ
jgi:hypothetical protein